MYAMIVEQLGGPSALERVERPSPEPGTGEVAIAVEAIGCNFADILITKGEYQHRPELPFSPGSEVAGRVARVGAGVDGLHEGQRILALLDHGGYASEVVAAAADVHPIPDAVSCEHAVALGVVYQTSWLALKHRAPLREGETLLVHAAAGGVGLAAVQIGAAMGARVIGTAGSPDKLQLAREHGATEALSYRDGGWVERVNELTDGRGADVIFDPVGGDAFERSTKCIAWEGRLHVIGFASGTIPSMRMNRVMLKNISLVGLHWGPYRRHDPALIQRAMQDLFAMHERGDVRPLVGATFPLEHAADALESLGGRKTTGKVILTP
ncbi:MAG: NADPH:quinone oxidoreductase family protein [Polyangiales bacterium]